ncbi:MAG: GNAT family N-acetyltransferase [Clostridia bacterium]|nr:GNAT family N-acetyltransferase [Clostridia bacterium]
MLEIKEVDDLEVIRSLWDILNRHKQIHSRHFSDYFSRKTFENFAEEIQACEKYRLEVVYSDDSPLGFCVGSRCKNNGYVHELYVHDDLRGNGLGRYLFNRMILWLESEGCEIIDLHVTTGNEEVISFYHKQGFNTFRYTLRKVKEE